MAKAIESKKLPEWVSKLEARKERLARKKSFDAKIQAIKGKKYSDLTKKQKDDLPRLLAEHLGILSPE